MSSTNTQNPRYFSDTSDEEKSKVIDTLNFALSKHQDNFTSNNSEVETLDIEESWEDQNAFWSDDKDDLLD